MNKEQLTEWGIAEDAADQVLAMIQKEAEKQKQGQETAKAELDSLKTQLKDANKKIEEFKGMDIEGIRKAADEYKTKFEEAEQKAKADLETLQFNYALDGALQGAKAKNTKAVKALLDMEGLKYSNGEMVGLKEQLEKLKTENDFLFESDKPVPKAVGFAGNFSIPNGMTKDSFQKMGYLERLSLKMKNPDTYTQLKGE